MTNNDKKVNDEYDKYIRKFCKKYEDAIDKVDGQDATNSGYIFIFVRATKDGCIDIASNMDNQRIEYCLETALAKIRE